MNKTQKSKAITAVLLSMTLILLILTAVITFSDYNQKSETEPQQIYHEQKEPAQLPEVNSASTNNSTLGEKNALKHAKTYLNVMPFSYEGLIEQLEYEGYTHNEAVYGADNCGADWYEEAYKKAQSYLDIMSFSRSGLIEQLEYEGFTTSEAEYAADMVGY